MRLGNLDIIAPHVTGNTISEAEVLGSAVWLGTHSKSHCDAPLQLLSRLLLPAIKNRQFVLASENGSPVFYLAWAGFSVAAEWRYLNKPPHGVALEDWNSGNRIWMLDWVAPFGHTRAMYRVLVQHIFRTWTARSVHHRCEERGLHIVNFHGMDVSREEARFWFQNHPPATDRHIEESR